MRFRVKNVFGTEDSSEKAGYDGGFGMDSKSRGRLGETLRQFRHVSSSWCALNFDHHTISLNIPTIVWSQPVSPHSLINK